MKRKVSVKTVKEKREREMEKGQVWSIDVLLAVVIFVSIIIVFYNAISPKDNPGLVDLQSDARLVEVEVQQNPELAFLEADEVNLSKLDEFTDSVSDDYNDVKQKLGIRGDFCIYYEDERGNLFLLKDNRTGVGGSDVTIGPRACGVPET